MPSNKKGQILTWPAQSVGREIEDCTESVQFRLDQSFCFRYHYLLHWKLNSAALGIVVLNLDQRIGTIVPFLIRRTSKNPL